MGHHVIFTLILICVSIKSVARSHLTLLYSSTYQKVSLGKFYLFLELLTEAYRKACSEGAVVMYRAHVALLGDSNATKNNFIGVLLDEPKYSSRRYHEIEGVKVLKFKSKFNKGTHKTEKWSESVSNSSDLMTDFRDAVLSHIRSFQHGGQAEGVMETLQQPHLSLADSVGKKPFISSFKSNKTGKQGVRQNTGYKLQAHEKELAATFQNPDNKTLVFLHRNAQIKETPDNNIPYSINLWDFDSQDEFSAMNQLFLNAETLIVYTMDITLELFSPHKQNLDERRINENSKTSAEKLRYCLNSVHIQAKKQSLKPNFVLLLTHTDSIKVQERSQYVESYIKKLTDIAEGKPYAAYISKENIILVDSFKGIRDKLFDRIMMQPTWGVKKPIRWLHLETHLLRRTECEEKSYLRRYEIDDYDDDDDYEYANHHHAERRPHVLVSKVKELALECGMDECELDSFLEFHHDLGNFICCPPSKLGQFIITHPQWLLNKFSKLLAQISHTHRYDEPWYYQYRYDESLHYSRLGFKAITSRDELYELWRQNAQFVTDLMINFHFILPLDSDNYWSQTYLIPCMLPPEKSYLHETELTYSSVYIAQELEFHRLLCICAKQSNWKLRFNRHISNQHASFDVNLGTHLVLNQKSNNTVEVSTRTSIQELDKGHISNDDIRVFLFDIHKEIARKMETLGVNRSKVFRILCPHWKPGDECLCLVEFERQTEKRPDNFVFHPISNRCAIHKKMLEPSSFLSTGEFRKGI